MAINPHHLELFHYVARHGGIAGASKNMPYGIGESAISQQISKLESDLGITLFQRRPFNLTPEGEKLHAATESFFRTLERLEAEFRGGASPLLRIGATGLIQSEHLPPVIERMRKAVPSLRIAVRDGTPAALGEAIRLGELDAGVCLIEGAPPEGLVIEPLLETEPVLVVPASHPARTAEEVLAGDLIRMPLISLPSESQPCVVFQSWLRRTGRVWEPSLELACLPFVYKYTLIGYGVGLGVRVPGQAAPAGLRELPLPERIRLTVGIVHNGRPHALRDAFVAASREHTVVFRAGKADSAPVDAAPPPPAKPAKKSAAKRK